MPRPKSTELSGSLCILRMTRFEKRVLRGMMDESKRPALAAFYNHHPELIADLIRRADINRRFTFDYEREGAHETKHSCS